MIDNTSPETASAADEKVKPGDDIGLYIKLKAWWKEHLDAHSDWREEAIESYGFVSGEGQWSTDDMELLKKQMRPLVTFNRVGAVIDSVAGMEVNNRQEVHYLPRQMGNAGVAELETAAAKWARDSCEAEDEESDAFWDTIVCGMGWTETRPDYEEDPEGLILIERADPLEMGWDPAARKRNLSDRRWSGRAREFPLEEARDFIKSMGIEADDDELDARWARADRDDTRGPHDATPQLAYNQGDQTNHENDRRTKVTIVFMEWWDREQYHIVADPQTGQKHEFSKEKFALLNRKLSQAAKAMGQPAPKVPSAQMTRKVYKQAFLGGKVLKTGPGRAECGFSLNAVTGKRDRNKNVFYGLVRVMKDPQRWANKFFSQTMHIINSNAKGGLMVEKSAVDNVRNFEATWSDPAGITWLNDGAVRNGQVMPKTAITYPSGLDKLMEYAVSSIRDVTGVNLEVLGMADREQAASLEYQRKQSAMTILAPMFDSLRRYRKEQGKVLLYCIKQYMPPGRLIKIDGETGAQYVPLVFKDDTVKYDIVVDEAATSPNQKEATWAMITQLMPFLAKLGLPPDIMGELFKFSPLPESVTSKIAQRMTQIAQQPPPPDPKVQAMQMQAELDAQKQQADQQQAQAQIQLQMQQAQVEQQLEAAKLQSDAQTAAVKLRLEQEKIELTHALKIAEINANLELEQRAMAASHELERQKAAAQIGLEREKFGAQADLETDRLHQSQSIEREKAGLPKKATPKKTVTFKRDKAGALAGAVVEEH